jgi:hypothetical protein
MFDLGFDIVKFIWRFFKWGLSLLFFFFNSKSLSFSFITFFGSWSKKSSLVPWTHYKFPYARDGMGTKVYNKLN